MGNAENVPYPNVNTSDDKQDLANRGGAPDFITDEEAVQALQVLEKRRKQRRKKKIITAIIAVAVLAAIAAAVWFVTQHKEEPQQEGPQVETDFVIRDDYSVPIEGSGTLKAASADSVTPEVEGTVAKVFVQEGQHVEKGDTLFTIESPDVEKGIQEAAAKVGDADKSVAKAQSAVSKAQGAYSKANSSYQSVKSKADAAKEKYLAEKKKVDAAKAEADKKGQEASDKVYEERLRPLYHKEPLKSKTEKVTQLKKDFRSDPQGTFENAVDIVYSNDEGYSPTFRKQMKEEAEVSAERAYDAKYKTVNIPKMSSSYDKDAWAEKLDTAKAAVETAQGELDAAREEVSTAQEEVSAAQEAYAEAEKEREKCTIKAPSAGTLTSFSAKEGQNLGSSEGSAESIARIEDLSKMKVSIAVSENDITKIEKGQSCTVYPSAFPDMELAGKVSEVASAATGADDAMAGFDGGSVEFEVDVIIDKPDAQLKSGMSVKVEVQTQEMKDVLIVPAAAITEEEDGSYVEVVTDSEKMETEMKKVQVVTQDSDRAVIKKGVSEGDEVIVSRIDFSADIEEGDEAGAADTTVDDESFEKEAELAEEDSELFEVSDDEL